MGKNTIQDIYDSILYLGLLGIAILVFLKFSDLWGILLLIAYLLFFSVLILFRIPGLMARFKYPRLVKLLSKYSIVRENEIQKLLPWNEEKIHKGLYELSKSWTDGPLVVLVKYNYLYLNKQVSQNIQTLIQKIPRDDDRKKKELQNTIYNKFKLQSRAELDAVIKNLAPKSKINKEKNKN
ncbi:MAG: hypothetical protein ACTSVU_08755 [Promethearchaeota archaeon]